MPFSTQEISVSLALEYISNELCVMNFEDINTFASTISIELEDKETGEIIDLRQNPIYSFNYDTNGDPERFVLHFNGATSIKNNQQLLANIYNSEDKLFVIMPKSNNEYALLEVFNNSGQKIMSSEISAQDQHIIDFSYPRGLYVVVLTMNNQITKKKIIIY